MVDHLSYTQLEQFCVAYINAQKKIKIRTDNIEICKSVIL